MNPRKLRDRKARVNPRAKFLVAKGVITEKDAIAITKLLHAEDNELYNLGMLMLNEHWKKHWGHDKYTRKYRFRQYHNVRF